MAEVEQCDVARLRIVNLGRIARKPGNVLLLALMNHPLGEVLRNLNTAHDSDILEHTHQKAEAITSRAFERCVVAERRAQPCHRLVDYKFTLPKFQ